ncbi:O-antigen ligase family protein [Candidatus Peregrinibacteria bacterium]|nr:O-antigen ligase family protein [Candidatus Peregrinibacteria bacterium]
MENIVIAVGGLAYLAFGLFRLRSAIIWLPLFIPTYLIKGEFGGIPVTLVEVLIYTLVVAYLIRSIKALVEKKSGIGALFSGVVNFIAPQESLFKKYGWLIVGMAGILVAAGLSFLVTEKELPILYGNVYPSLRIALGILKGWILAPILYALLLLGVVRKTKEGLDVLNAYTISAVILSLWALYQVIAQDFITPDMRASGPFENANYLALYIGPALLYMTIRVRDALFPLALIEGKRRWSMPFLKGKVPVDYTLSSLVFTAALILLFALIASKSYGAMVAVFVAGIFYFGMEYWQYWRKEGKTTFPWKVTLLAAAGLFLILLIVFAVDPSKWQAMFQFSQRNSSSVRIEVYSIAWGLLADNWLLGVGMGQFQALYQLEGMNILGHVPYELNMLHPHNFALAIWLNLGILGLASFILILALGLQKVWPHFTTFFQEKVKGVGKVRMIAFAMMLSIVVHGFFDTPFFKNDLALLFWIVLGVLIAVEKED